MDVVIAGGHGQVARALARALVGRGDQVRGLIRNPDHAGDLRQDGSDPVVLDLESASPQEIAERLAGADAAVFAAGAGPGSGPERKWTVDRDGAVKLLDAARLADVPRYVIVSSVGTDDPPDGDDVFSVYLRAKAEADRAVAESDREWTIVRPGRLTDDPGSGRVRISLEAFRGQVPREDVAGVLAEILHAPATAGRTLYVNRGDEPMEQAVADVG